MITKSWRKEFENKTNLFVVPIKHFLHARYRNCTSETRNRTPQNELLYSSPRKNKLRRLSHREKQQNNNNNNKDTTMKKRNETTSLRRIQIVLHMTRGAKIGWKREIRENSFKTSEKVCFEWNGDGASERESAREVRRDLTRVSVRI